MTPAGVLQAYLKLRVKETGGQYRKVRWEGRVGCPDCFVWWTWPQAAFIEIKAEGDRLRKLQALEIERMKASGVPVFIARSRENLDEIIAKIRLTA